MKIRMRPWKKLGLVGGLLFGLTLTAAASSGSLFIIGGALRSDNAAIYQEMIRLGGGVERVKIGIISAASGTPVQTARGISEDFAAYGVSADQIHILPLAVVDDPITAEVDESGWAGNGFSADLVKTVSTCSLVFFSGGDQARYRRTLLDDKGADSPLLEAVRLVFQRGGVIAGTSAGAAVMSDPMIISGSSLAALTADPADSLLLDRGFGLFQGFMVDQHFLKRGRIGRLLSTLLSGKHDSGHRLGIGVDEDTALVVQGHQARVLGRSGCLLVDARHAGIEKREAGNRISDVRIHYLHQGDALDLETKGGTAAAERCLIEPGKEYNERFSSSSDVFGRDVLVRLMTEGLGDCRQHDIFGLAFDPSGSGERSGVRLKLSKMDETRAYLGHVAGEYSYTVLHVRLDLEPVTVQVFSR